MEFSGFNLEVPSIDEPKTYAEAVSQQLDDAIPPLPDYNDSDVAFTTSPEVHALMEPDPPVGDSVFDDPAIVALQAQISEIMGSIDTLTPELAELSAASKQAKEEKELFLVEIRKQIAKFDSRAAAADQAARKIERQIRDATEAKDKLLADISHKMAAAEAAKQLEVARKRWQDIIEQNDWLWAKAAREYQSVAIQFIANSIDQGLFGVGELDQMGLGKTLIARGAVDLIQNHEKFEDIVADRCERWVRGSGEQWATAVLWLCPDSAKQSTAKELAKWSTHPVVVLEGTPEQRKHIVTFAHMAGLTVVAGYAQMRDRGNAAVTPALFDRDWPIIIMDEVHFGKNRDSSTFMNLEKLVDSAGYVIPMTGTPVENKAAEFWTILHLITAKGARAGEFETFARFERMYLGSWDQQFRYNALNDLMESVSDMVIRRRKEEVLKDLPDKVRSVRMVQMVGEQRKLYDEMRERLYIWLDQEAGEFVSGTNFLAQLTRLRQIALYPRGVKIKHEDSSVVELDCDESAKIDDAMDLIRQMMANDEKVLVFSSFKDPLYRIQRLIAEEGLTWTNNKGEQRLVRSKAITGDTKSQDRPLIQENFNDAQSDVRVVVGTIRAMGVALNLQEACSQEIFLDLDWNPGKNEQAEDRLHRMGQKSNVTVHIIQAEQSVDAFIAGILEEKSDVSDHMFERESLRKALDEGLI